MSETAPADAPHRESTANADEASVARSTWSVSALTLASRILGLVRDKLLVVFFGAEAWVLDAFLLAFQIPNLFRRLFGEGALTAAFIPVFIRVRQEKGAEAANALAGAILTLLALVTGGIAALGMVLAWGAAAHFASVETVSLTLRLLLVMLPFLCLICCSALLAGMLQSVRVFALPGAMSIVLNVSFLAAFGYIHYRMGEGAPAETVYAVALAVVAAGAIQLLIQYPALRARGVTLRPRLALKETHVQEVLRALGPTALGLGVVQVNVLVDNLIAGWLSFAGGASGGAVTHLYLGNRLMQLPLGVFGIAVATTVFPFFASHAAAQDWPGLARRITTAVRMVVFIVLPAAVGLAVVGKPVVQLIFQSPDLTFSDESVRRTTTVLACYAAGLVFFSLQHVFTRVHYALGDYRTPVRIAAAMVGVNLVLNLLLIHAPDLYQRWAFQKDIPLREAGLALATTLTALLNVGLLWAVIKRRLRSELGEDAWEAQVAPVAWSLVRIVLASALMGVFVYFCVGSIPYEPELWARLERSLAPVVLGAGAYVVLCFIVPIPEFDEFVRRRKTDNGASSSRES